MILFDMNAIFFPQRIIISMFYLTTELRGKTEAEE